MYQLIYHPPVARRIARLHPNDRKRTIEKLEILANNPRNPLLNGTFRLRIGDIRAIFELDTKEKIIYIWDVDYRGSIY